MTVDDRLALEIGRATLRALKAEAQLDTQAAEIVEIRAQLDELAAQIEQAEEIPDA